MLRLVAAAAALAIMTLPVAAQTSPSGGTGNVTVPNAPNSGAGIPGKPGNKSGPAVKPPSATTGAGSSSMKPEEGRPGQDASKIPGQPGNKSGPAAKPQSEPNSK